MDFAEELRACLQGFLSDATLEIRENGGRVTPSGPLSWEVRGASAKPLLHLWAENCNITRRILAVTSQSEDRMALAVERFGRSKPDRMEIVRLNFARSPRQLFREEFCEQLRRILAEQFPDESIERLSIAADLEHSLSGVYARGIAKRGHAECAFLAVPEGESQDTMESSLTYALLWLNRVRQTNDHSRISTLRLILPKGRAPAVAQRLAAVDSQLAVQVYELDPLSEAMERVNPCANGNLATWLVPQRESQRLLDRADAALSPILTLAPGVITAHASPQNQEVLLRFRGLVFARWHDGIIHFGTDSVWEELTSDTESALEQLVLNLQTFRGPLASDLRHPLYRGQAERWMQSIVLEDVSRVDILLDPRHVYEQVFVQSAGQHGILDLLGVTRTGRLAILELKATENLDMPLQAADYWSRIRRHQAQGDLVRNGYFAGLELQSAPPLVYLVAPALRFHPSTDALLHFLSPEMEVIRVGLAESWRRGLRVMMRQ